jgi:hypothetical protein
MGQNIAQSVLYSKSIGEAMRASVASTLAGLASESIVYAIYSTGLGFLRLAQHDYAAASQAFQAAATGFSIHTQATARLNMTRLYRVIYSLRGM